MPITVQRAAYLISVIALGALASYSAFAQSASSGIDTVGLSTLPFSIQGTEIMELGSPSNNPPPNNNTLKLLDGNMDFYTSVAGATLTLQANAPSGNGVAIGSAGTGGNGTQLTVYGGIITYDALAPTSNQYLNESGYQVSPQIFVNGDNHKGGGIEISANGGFFDFNDTWITFVGAQGLHIAGSTPTTQGNLLTGTITATGNIVTSLTSPSAVTINNSGITLQNIGTNITQIVAQSGAQICLNSNPNTGPTNCDSYWGQLQPGKTSLPVQGGYATCQATTDQYGQAYINGSPGRLWSAVTLGTQNGVQVVQFTVCMVDQTGVWLSDNSGANWWNTMTAAQQQAWLLANPPQPQPQPQQQNYSGYGSWQ